tara:strand:- start:5324 stop:7273 length:1950 start_codon:yes stop_codon:yes gene_type:complete
MRLRHITEGVGLVVKGVNTTPDVGVDAIQKQAAKFGFKVDKKGKPAYTMHKKAHKNSDPNTLFNLGMAESRKDIKYTKPNLDSEWDEATRYEEFKKLGKDKWIELVNKGKVVEYNTKTVQKMSNTDAVNVKDFDNLDKDKQARALKQLEKGSIELPIVASYSDGHLELVGGNTRLTAVMKATGKGKVWQFDVPDGLVESRKEIWNEWKIMPQTIKPMGLIHKAGKGPNNRFDFKNKANNRANEDETKLSSASEIYVDMDGVLVDFFGPWTKMMGVDDWRQIKDVDAALQKIRDTKDFWINLKPTANADNLLSVIKEIKGEYNILSAPMADDPRVEPSKKEWVEKNLTAFPPKKVIITSAKSQYATQSDGTPNILIDDFGQNVSKWEASGGVGFKHKDHKFERTAKNLKQYFEKPATERELTKGEEKDKERFVKGMKKNKADFKKRYGKDADAVMYATATKMAKNEGDLIPNPKNSIVAKADTAYDFLKLGVNMANIKDVNPDDMNPDEPDVMVNFFGGEKEKEYMMSQLKRLGYKVQDVDGYTDAHYDEKPTKGKAPPQVKGEDVEDFITKKGNAPIDRLIPVQKDRKFKKLGKAMVRVLTDKMPPIIVDNQGHIINGHHRYDALRLLGVPTAKVAMIGGSLKEIMDLM